MQFLEIIILLNKYSNKSDSIGTKNESLGHSKVA